ncbi:MAG: hypothetical protein ACO23G_14595 [Limnohabitans sp.]
MNPLGIIATAASLTLSIGLMFTSDAEVDTWGLVPGSTAYSPVEPGTLPDASGSDYSAVTTQVQYQGPGCQEWADTAVRGGFVLDDLRIALQVAELESACLPNAIGDNGQSWGLMQINNYWCTPVKYWPGGYLQTQGIIDSCTELLDPLTNMHAAWHIATHYGWNNWTTYERIDG